ncbi:non-ribosomal peptide synthetase, partial [Rhypophila decipiens]
MDTPEHTPPIPRLDMSTSWLLLEDEPVENRLLAVVAQVLDMDKEDVQVHESFLDLGGDDQTASALRKSCMHAGMDVKVKDILRCATLAELQTCVVPCARQPPSPVGSDIVEMVEPIMVAPLEIYKASGLYLQEPKSTHSRHSSQSSSKSHSAHWTDIEKALGTQKSVSRIATVRPKAGLLEGKFVALLTLANTGSAETSPTAINLIPQAHSHFAATQVAALKEVAESVLAADNIPDVWIALDGMPLTESGEIDIRRIRTWAQNINSHVLQQALSLENQEALQAPSSQMEKSLQRLVSKVLDVPQSQIGVNFSFCQLGGDEMTAIELVARCKHESIFINAAEALESNTLADLAAMAASRGGLAHKWDDETKDHFALSPMQHLYFQTAMGGEVDHRASVDGSYRFNLSFLLRFKKHYTLEDISAAIAAVVGHHPMLRSRFSHGMTGWMQRVLPDVAGSYAIRSHSVSSENELERIIAATQNAIDVTSGPLFVADYITTHDSQQMVYLAAHHLAVDIPSWRIIIHDLDELLDNGSLLSQRSMPFHKWVDLQRSSVQGVPSDELLPYQVQPGDYAYWGLQSMPNTYADAVEVSFSLSHELTSILQTSCNQVFKTDCVDIYLAALMLSFAQTFHDRPVPVIWNQEHGREPTNQDVDISETVGWFTSLCPIKQSIETSDDFISVLRHLKDTRRSIPARGSQYFASRFYNHDRPDLFTHDWPFEIIFSYAGSYQHLERDNGVMELLPMPGRTLASKTSDIGSKVGRIALFEISAMIDQGTAKIKFLYSRYSKDQERISLWVQNYEHLLLEAIGRLRYHPQELTLADVPHLDVTYEGLHKFNKQQVPNLKLASVRDIETIYPVTAVQQNILVSQAQRPETCYLHAIYEFASPNGDSIDTARICTAWQQVTMRHSALRTVFTDSVSETGLWDMVILRRASPEMLFIDTAPAEDPVYELSNLPNLRPADNKPLHRLTVCKAPTRTFVKLDISTALCDSTSIHILLYDLRRAYVTERAVLDAVHFSYPQYLQFLKGIRQETSIAFWRERLEDVSQCHFPRLSLAKERKQKFSNACIDLDITSYELSAFGRTHKTTTADILRLAWGLILRCFTGSNNVCFGYQTMGRDESVEGLRHAVGAYANVVPCNYELPSYTPLTLALKTVEAQMEACLPHQNFTVAELQHAMGIKGGERLFNSCLTFTEEPGGLNSKFTTRTNFELKPVSLQQTFDVDVVINARFSSGKLVVDIGQRIMSPEQSLNVASTFGKAIRSILASPTTHVGLVDLFSDRDYAQIVAWGAESPPASDAQVQCVLHELITKQASLQPNGQAICSWDGSFTYEQLDEDATKLGHYLVEAGVGPHSVVPVVMEKGRLAPVAMLAVLKAGGAFVPIDALELGMIQPIFERLNSRVAIASELASSVLRNLFETVVVVDDDLMAQLPDGQGSLTSMAAPSDPACILFVPTSSNEARGVSFSHSALSTALLGQGPAAKITALSRVMHLSSFNVDICIAEIFTTLIYGGCVCVPSASERLQDFTGAVNRMQVNWSYMTPLLSRKVDPALLPSLKVVCFRTRSLDEDTYSPWHGKANVILAYGPQDVSPLGISFLEAIGTQHLRSIGRPFCGNLLVVNPDDLKKPVPVGAVGELIVQGPTLGCSYPNRESTIGPISPLGVATGSKARYFKTGHRVRYTEGGLMEFISNKREDPEIDGKVVNIVDIEEYLRRCLGQGIDVIVDTLTFRGSKNAPVLAAFVELGDSVLDEDESLANLSTATREKISTARQLVEIGLKSANAPTLTPSIYIPVRHLPITPSLKVNRRRLQKMISGLSREQLVNLSTVPNTKDATLQLKPLPLTKSEEKMRAIWANVLGIDRASIGTTDCFFALGGDDTTAVRLVTACRRENLSVPIASVLDNPTLTELCKAMVPIEPTPAAVVPKTTPSLPTVPSLPSPVPANVAAHSIKDTFIQKVLAPKIGVDPATIADAAEASAVQIRYIETGMLKGRANINYLVFSFTGNIDSKKLEEACKILVEIHPIMRTAFIPYSRRVYQAVIKTPEIEFKRQSCPTWRLSSLLEKAIRKDQSAPIAFCSPMTKFMFLDGGKQSTLVVRLSKAQYDDLSIALLVKDLKRLYDGTQSTPRRPSYCDFVRCVQAANQAGAEEYWRTLLEGGTMTQIVGHIQPYPVTANTKALKHLMPIGSLSSLGISFETVLKSAWGMVLASLSGSSDVVFGEVIDGRHVRLGGGYAIAGVMGPTINAIPVRVQFPETPLTPLALLQYVHAQRIAGIPFENLGTLTIVEKCTPWPYWTRFSSLVQHQFEDTAISPSEPKSFHLGSATCKFTVMESKAQDIPDLFVRSIVRGPGRVELSISFCADRIPEPFAEHALRTLCATISLLTSVSIMQPIIPCGYQYRAVQRRIPLVPPVSLPPASVDSTFNLSPDQTHAIQSMISNAWTTVLNPRVLGVPESQIHNAAFYDLWGSLIPAAQLTAHLNRELPKIKMTGTNVDLANIKLTMEEIVEHPTMLKQFELILRRIRQQVTTPAPKGKEKEKEAVAAAVSVEPTAAEQSKLTTSATTRKKPNVNLSVSTAALGSRIRRLASTVVRSNDMGKSPPLPISAATASPGGGHTSFADIMSPFSPKSKRSNSMLNPLGSHPPNGSSSNGSNGTTPITTPISRDAPQLPSLPSFMPIAEEEAASSSSGDKGKSA